MNQNFHTICRRIRKIAKSDCYFRHVCPSVPIEQLGSHWKEFHEIYVRVCFEKSVENIQVSLQSDANDGFTWRPVYTFDYIALSSSWNEKCFRQKIIKTLILCSVSPPPRKSFPLWDKVEECYRAEQATDDRIVHAWYLRLQIHRLLFHCGNGCTGVPQCYVIACLVSSGR